MATVAELTQSIDAIKTSVDEGFSALATHLDTETQQVLAAIAAAAGQGVDLTPVADAVESLRVKLSAGFLAAQNAIDQVIP